MPDLPDNRGTVKAAGRGAFSSPSGPDEMPHVDGSDGTSAVPQKPATIKARQLQRKTGGRKRAEDATRAEAGRYRTLFDLVPVAVYTTDAKGVIQEFNHRAVELWGRLPRGNREKFCGSFKIYYPDGRFMPHDQCPMARVLRGEQLQASDLDLMVEQENGERRSVLVAPRALLDERGRIVGAINCLHDITSRKQMQAALKESEQSFRMVADNIPQLIWTNNGKGKADYFNLRWYEYSGLTYQDSVGLGWEAIVHPDDAARAKQQWRQALAARKVFEAEYRLRRHDGAYHWHIGRNVPMRDSDGDVISWFGTATDIDDFKKAEAALRESEERYRLLVDGARDYAIFLLNPSNEIVYWSAGAERVFGWSAEEAVGQSGEIVFTPEDRKREQEEKEIEIALKEGSASDRRWHIRKDGVRIWVDGVMRRLEDEQTGALRGFAKIARDRTEQRTAEQELQRAHEELERRVRERTAELQAKNRLLRLEVQRRQMLENEILRITERERARIGQDLHDSLCQELTATAFLLKSRAKAIAPQNKAAADSLAEAAETVNANAGLARDLARGLHPFELGSAGLPSALRELCSRASEQMSCRCDCPRSLRLEQNVALNLYRIAQEAVTNSVKHAKANEIVISLERTNGEIILTVSDDGEGKRRRGRGLGTHIMHYRARAAGGTLDVESARGRGTTVACRVPVKR
jgi:PAS domain S-box-containing protein